MVGTGEPQSGRSLLYKTKHSNKMSITKTLHTLNATKHIPISAFETSLGSHLVISS